MNMASIDVLVFIFTVICVCAEDLQNVFVRVQCKEMVGQYGQQSLLECVVLTTHGVADAEIGTVSWRKEGVEKPLLVFTKGEITIQQPGYKFAEPSWNNKNMNVSLLITNTAMTNAGVYTCLVITNSGDDESRIQLNVIARYSEPIIRSIPEKITGNADAALICDSIGGYPEGEIQWIVEGNKEWTKSSEMKVEQAQSGLFRLTSKLTLLRGSIFSKYTCVVFNASGGKEAEAIYTVEDIPEPEELGGRKGMESASKIVAPVVVIGSVLIGLMIVLLVLYRLRSQRDRQEVFNCDPDAEDGMDTA
uniref:Ig-like domain-containing protein n=1 Tax=Scophthalmus maximus TaxID=52904 RepID=A0A8D3AXC2_SCOMX